MLSVIVEISEGDYNKYEYNHALGVLEVDRVLYGPLFYPVNYCDVPGTWNKHDQDPLDAILFSSRPIIPGAMVKGRVIGALEMIDNGEIDHKIVCVNAKDPRFDYVKTASTLSATFRRGDDPSTDPSEPAWVRNPLRTEIRPARRVLPSTSISQHHQWLPEPAWVRHSGCAIETTSSRVLPSTSISQHHQ